jgi:hypothetical protein
VVDGISVDVKKSELLANSETTDRRGMQI